jgi:hypothetical protein
MLALLAAARSVPAGEPSSPKSTLASQSAELTPDFMVVFWFDGQRFRHQAYDVRKGQYTQAVRDWVDYRPVDASGYLGIGRLATVRKVYLDRERGATEREKLDAATARELSRIEGFDARRLRWNTLPAPVARAPRAARRVVRAPSLRAVPSGPASPMPQPLPYPRPHP